MAHVREQLVTKFIELLTGLSTTGAKVYNTRLYPYDEIEHIPSLNIYAGPTIFDEESAVMGNIQAKITTIIVEIRVKDPVNQSQELETINAEVEDAIMTDRTLGGIVNCVDYVGTEVERSVLDQPVALATLEFEVSYRVNATDPETIVS